MLGLFGKGPSIARARVVAAFTAAFVAGSLVIFALVSLAGAVVPASVPFAWRAGLAAASLAALAIIDVLSIREKGFCLLGLRRQTPKRLQYQYGETAVAAAWGFDAGLAVTTFRVAAITWAALLLTLLGFSAWWTGLGYGAAFVVPMLVLITRPAGGAQLAALLGRRSFVQFASAIMLAMSGLFFLSQLFA